MNKSVLKLGVLIGLLASFKAYAGRESNGGGVWACRESNNEISWVEPVDLFESEYTLGLKVKSNGMSSQNEIITNIIGELSTVKAQTKIGDQFVAALQNTIYLISQNLKVLPITLNEVDDYSCLKKPALNLCDGTVYYYQAVNYHTNQGILVSELIWDKLSQTQRAAILIHEAVYKLLREERFGSDMNSLRAREITGYLMSDQTAEVKLMLIELLINSTPLSLSCQ